MHVDQVVAGPELRRGDGLHRELQVAERTLDAKTVALNLLTPLRAKEKRHVGACFRKPSAEVAADAARAQDEQPHGFGSGAAGLVWLPPGRRGTTSLPTKICTTSPC